MFVPVSVLCALLSLTLARSTAAPPPRVNTTLGPIQGTTVTEEAYAFLGIPYAAPPLGKLRWATTQPHPGWSSTRLAIAPGRSCPQSDQVFGGIGPQSEDCLFLNVWTPTRPTSEALPVMVWIHGGAFITGSGAQQMFDGRYLVALNSSVIVVTLNYRLGGLGFLTLVDSDSGTALLSGNYGLMDQQFALRWVRANAKAFGGDPSRVTLFGESAGGHSVSLHMVMPSSRGLFSGAIVQSGSAWAASSNYSSVQESSAGFGKRFLSSDEVAKCSALSGASLLKCLRSLPADAIVKASASGKGFFGFQTSALHAGAFADRPWPTVDGTTIPDTPYAMFSRGDIARVPLIIGDVGNEGSIFAWAGLLTFDEDKYQEMIAQNFNTSDQKALLELYPPTGHCGLAQQTVGDLYGDMAYLCPSRQQARWANVYGLDVYTYTFTEVTNSVYFSDVTGAFHSSELPYVFDHDGASYSFFNYQFTAEEKDLANQIASYWTNFASYGSPNPAASAISLPHWPKFMEGGDYTVQNLTAIGIHTTTERQFKAAECAFWSSYFLRSSQQFR